MKQNFQTIYEDDNCIVYRYVCFILEVNTYVLLLKDSSNVYIIDPGGLATDFVAHLKTLHPKKIYIYITHEHYDHHAGIHLIKQNFDNLEVYVPHIPFLEALNNPRRNLSYYFKDSIFEQHIPLALVTYQQDFFEMIETRGHSLYNWCFRYQHLIFGGDTIIDASYRVLGLPKSNRVQYAQTILYIKNIFDAESLILPGHGEIFHLKDWNRV